jgi:Stage II sporulation protein E (SpoIIE)
VGDVSGKGLKAAMVGSLLTGALRNRKSDEPAAILGDLNRVAASALRGGVVTAAVARVDGDHITIANAGHLAPYLAGVEAEVEAGLPLGIDPETSYAETDVLLTGGLTFVSDGVMEAANAKDEFFAFDRTRPISGKSASEIAETARAWGSERRHHGSHGSEGGHDVETQRNSQSGVQFGQLFSAQSAHETAQHQFWQADQLVAMHAAFVLQAFLDADINLRAQTIPPRVHRSTDSGGKSGTE